MNPAQGSGGETLESILNKATNPSNVTEDWKSIYAFCDMVKEELEGPQHAVKLLAHKIQSPQEKEALFALSLADACVKRCGPRFHSEIGKFRFLNEIIKVISPKYLGSCTTAQVKTKCIESLYTWSRSLPQETKIGEAYSMLRQQGLIHQDPQHLDHKIFKPPTPPPRPPSIFDDPEKSKLLSSLLKSRKPEDLAAANRLIKSVVQEDNYRIEKISQRLASLDTVRNNCKLLEEMLHHYQPGKTETEDVEIMKELVSNMEKARPALFKLGQDTDENDQEGLNEIINTSDCVNNVIKRYRELVEENAAAKQNPPIKHQEVDLLSVEPDSPADDLLSTDLAALGLSGTSVSVTEKTSDLSLMDFLPPSNIAPKAAPASNYHSLTGAFSSQASSSSRSAASPPNMANGNLPTSRTSQAPTPSGKAFDELNNWTKEFFQLQKQQVSNSAVVKEDVKTLPPSSTAPVLDLLDDIPALQMSAVVESGAKKTAAANGATPGHQDELLLDLGLTAPLASSADISAPVITHHLPSATSQPSPHPVTSKSTSATATRSFADLTKVAPILLKDIRPHQLHLPKTVHTDENHVKMQLHFTRDPVLAPVLGESGEQVSVPLLCLVVVISSENENPLTQIRLQLVAPKTCRLRLLPQSTDTLPAYSPFVPPSAIHQIVLVDNPNKENLSLKYRLSYELDGDLVDQSGTMDSIPVM